MQLKSAGLAIATPIASIPFYFKSTPNVVKFFVIIINSTVTVPDEMVDNLYLNIW